MVEDAITFEIAGNGWGRRWVFHGWAGLEILEINAQVPSFKWVVSIEGIRGIFGLLKNSLDVCQ